MVDGGDIADRVEVSPWTRAGFEDAPGDRVFLLWARTKETWKVPPGARKIVTGCRGKLSGSWTFTKTHQRTFSIGASFKVTLWKILDVGVSGSGSKTTGASTGTTVATGEWGGPDECYEWKAYALGEWKDVYSFKDLVDPSGPIVPPMDPIGGASFMGNRVGGGWTGAVSKIVCRKYCCPEGGS